MKKVLRYIWNTLAGSWAILTHNDEALIKYGRADRTPGDLGGFY
ncbi:MAG TPA: hypothetical protein VIJ12_06300 [Candidatus Baltobacteraceae bacterium]